MIVISLLFIVQKKSLCYFSDSIQKEVFDHGLIYVGVPPLYKVEHGNNSTYLYSEDERNEYLRKIDENTKLTIQRFKVRTE